MSNQSSKCSIGLWRFSAWIQDKKWKCTVNRLDYKMVYTLLSFTFSWLFLTKYPACDWSMRSFDDWNEKPFIQKSLESSPAPNVTHTQMFMASVTVRLWKKAIVKLGLIMNIERADECLTMKASASAVLIPPNLAYGHRWLPHFTEVPHRSLIAPVNDIYERINQPWTESSIEYSTQEQRFVSSQCIEAGAVHCNQHAIQDCSLGTTWEEEVLQLCRVVHLTEGNRHHPI